MTNNSGNYSLHNSNKGNQSTTSIYNTGNFNNVTYYSTSDKSYSDEGPRWKLLSAAVGIISAVIIAFGPALVKDDATAAENSKTTSAQAESKSPSSHETSAATTMPHPTETDSKGTEDPGDGPVNDSTSTGTLIPESYKPNKIDVQTSDYGMFGGRKIGPNKFEMTGSYLRLRYIWDAKNGESVIKSNNCEIVTKVFGPVIFERNKTSQCSSSEAGLQQLEFTAPGDYTIIVTDKQSNASGELKISIVR